MIIYNLITGHPNQAIPSLNKSIGQYKRHHKYLKIGITGQTPDERYLQHKKDMNWDSMIVIYESTSENYCNIIEAFLVDNHYEFLVNTRSGWGSKLREEGKNQHVTKHQDGWQVKGAGNVKATVVLKTQAEAKEIAKQIVRNQNSEVIIQGQDGKIREKNSYGNDPKNVKG